jgi:hypothetical protein
MFNGDDRRLRALVIGGTVVIVFVFLFLQAVGGLINSGSTSPSDDLLGTRNIGTAMAPRGASTRATASIGAGNCSTERGPLPDTTCAPTPAQVAAATGIPVPPNPANFTSTYEQFQDWHLEASFEVVDPKPYLSIAEFPGVTIGGGAVQAPQAADGSYRSLELTAQPNGTVLVQITAFTT